MKKTLVLLVVSVVSFLGMADVALASESVDAVISWWEFVEKYWVVVTSFVTFAGVIAAATPTPKDDGIVLTLRRIVDLIGLNVGFAKNKDK